MHERILIIDDEEPFREDFATLLRQKGYNCSTAADGKAGVVQAEDFQPQLVFCDIVMPGKGGLDVLEDITRICPESCVIMITAYGTLETAIEAIRKGAFDYILKPLSMEDIFFKIERFLKYKELLQEVKFLRRKLSQDTESLDLVAESEAIKTVFASAQKVAATRSTVLITGESGTGKEVIARAIHMMSSSENQPFMAINCAGIPSELLESEFFGHLRGAFTGAVKDSDGFFKLAGEGTIFLDEISEMPIPLQAKLLRVIEQKEFFPVGGRETQELRARIIVSTNRDLREMVKKKRFREDLYYRISVFKIDLPPLRERRSDIPLLVKYFIEKLNSDMKRRILGVENEVMHRFLLHSWPGNIRELKNVIEHAMILTQGDYITMPDLPPEITGLKTELKYPDKLKDAIQLYEKEHIRKVLQETGGNKEETARRLNIHPATLYRKLTQ